MCEQNSEFKTTTNNVIFSTTKNKLIKCKYWSFLKTSFSHEPWMLQSGHFFVIFSRSTFGVYIHHIVAQTCRFADAFSKFFSSIKLRFPKTNESQLDHVWSPDTPLTTSLSLGLNPLGPKSDQHQFSPNNISRSSRVKVMRITKLITKGRRLWSFIKFSQLFLKEMYRDQCGEFVCASGGLKGWHW